MPKPHSAEYNYGVVHRILACRLSRKMNEDMDDIIAAHKQVKQMLRHLTVIAERAREGIVVVDFDGAVRFVNAAWATMHGYETSEELSGKHISAFHTKEQMKTDVIPFVEEAKQRGQLAGPVEHVRRNGTPFPTEMLMVVFKDDVGEVMGLIGFATDLTEQERREDELKRCRYRLGELVKQQTDHPKAANAQLQHQIREREQADQRLKHQIVELSVANKRLQEQICEYEQVKNQLQQYHNQLEQRLREQSEELRVAAGRLQEQVNKLSARGRIGEADVCKGTPFRKNMAKWEPKAISSLKTAKSFTNDERSILVNVFRQNIALQKPELDDTDVDEGTA